MKVLVCGSRNWTDPDAVISALTCLPGEHVDIEILHGDARGADRMAAAAADYLGFSVRAFPADWKKYGPAAGPIRNQEMITERPDLVIAFGRGRGTDHTVRLAEKCGIPVQRIWEAA